MSLSKGLVLHQPLNKDHYNFTTKRFTDKSAYSNHGTSGNVLVDASFDSDRMGQGDRATKFNGASDYINCGNGDILDITDKITISVRIKPVLHIGYPIAKRDEDEKQFGIYLGPSSIHFYTWGLDYSISTTTMLTLNEWSHLVTVFDSSNETGEIYINNVPLADDTTATAIISTISDVFIGCRGDGVGSGVHFFRGSLADARIYNRVLSQQEITLLYESYRPKLQISDLNKGLVLHQPLDKNHYNFTTKRFTDKSAYGNHGTYDGFTCDMVEDTTETYIFSLCVFNGYLYAGTYQSGKIYRSSNGTDWTMVEETTDTRIFSLCVFNGYLYTGTGDNGKIYRSANGTDWTMVEDTTDTRVHTLCVFDNYLYAGTGPNGKIYRSANGTDWTMIEDTTESYIFSLCVFNGYLYTGTYPSGKIYRSSNGTDWTMVEDTTESYIRTLCVFNGYLYAGTATNGKIYRSANGTDWTMVNTTGESNIYALCVFNGHLYAGTTSNGKIYRSANGTDWTMIEDTVETDIRSLCVFNDYLYAGTGSGGKIYRMSDVLFDSDRMGQGNRATKFNGIDDYVNCGNDDILDITDEITISVRVKLNSLHDYNNYILDKRTSTTGYAMVITSATGKVVVRIGDTGGHSTFTSNSSISLDTWVNVVFVADGINEIIYLNGEIDKTTNVGRLPSTAIANLFVGIYSNLGASYALDGSLADIRIYNRALSEQEITLLYESYRV